MENIDLSNKPSRYEFYFRHIQLKVKTQKIIKKFGYQTQFDKWAKCNFKKNTNYKPMFSCGGYGGKCACCKERYNQEKQSFKNIDMKNAFKEWKMFYD